jgi:hypothetical protein
MTSLIVSCNNDKSKCIYKFSTRKHRTPDIRFLIPIIITNFLWTLIPNCGLTTLFTTFVAKPTKFYTWFRERMNMACVHWLHIQSPTTHCNLLSTNTNNKLRTKRKKERESMIATTQVLYAEWVWIMYSFLSQPNFSSPNKLLFV